MTTHEEDSFTVTDKSADRITVQLSAHIGDHVAELSRIAIDLTDKATREALIGLGWTPPGEGKRQTRDLLAAMQHAHGAGAQGTSWKDYNAGDSTAFNRLTERFRAAPGNIPPPPPKGILRGVLSGANGGIFMSVASFESPEHARRLFPGLDFVGFVNPDILPPAGKFARLYQGEGDMLHWLGPAFDSITEALAPYPTPTFVGVLKV